MTSKKKIEDLVEEQASALDDVPVVPEPVAVSVRVIVAGEGDSYASLAAKYAPKGVRVHDYAKELVKLNNGSVVRAGSRVVVK